MLAIQNENVEEFDEQPYNLISEIQAVVYLFIYLFIFLLYLTLGN